MKLHSRAWWGLSFLLALVLMIPLVVVGTAKASDTVDYYRGFSVAQTHPDQSAGRVLHVAPWANANGHSEDMQTFSSEVAFCFNMSLQPPNMIANRTHVHYQRSYDLRTAAEKDPKTTPRIADNEEFKQAVVKVIYNGYGYNAAGLKERYGLNDNELYQATQRAVWYYTDSRFTTGDQLNMGSLNSGYGAKVGEATAALLGYRDLALATPPADATLTVYTTNDTKDGADFQNLLTLTIRHGEDGPPIAVPGEPEKPQEPTSTQPIEPQAPEQPREEPSNPELSTTVSVDGKESSADNALVVPLADSVHVVDEVRYSGFEAGKEYLLRGELIDVTGGGEDIIASAQRVGVLESSSGTVSIDFGDVKDLQPGHTYVVFETAIPSEGGAVIEGAKAIEHHDKQDRAQTFIVTPGQDRTEPQVPENPSVPELSTTVSVDGQASSAEQALEVSQADAMAVVDTIRYSGLEAGEEYLFSGQLVDVTGDDDEVIATANTTSELAASAGTVEVDFGNVSGLKQGHTYVVFETAQRSSNGIALENAPLIEHRDRSDRAQTFIVKKDEPVQVEQTPEVPTQEVEEPQVPTQEVEEPEQPTQEVTQEVEEPELPTQEVEVPTQEVEVPTQEVEVPTQKVEVPTQKVVVPTKPKQPTATATASATATATASAKVSVSVEASATPKSTASTATSAPSTSKAQPKSSAAATASASSTVPAPKRIENTQAPVAPSQVKSAQSTPAAAQRSLANTGANVVVVALVGLALVGLGAVLAVRRKQQR